MKKDIERLIIGLILTLCILSVLLILSATINSSNYSHLYLKQLASVLIGIVLMLIFRSFPYKILEEISPAIYCATVIMLICVLFFGVEVHGGKRWFDLGLVFLQPVEIAKFSIIILLAMILEKTNRVIYAIIPVSLVMVLVFAEPDAGSALLFLPVCIIMLLVSRVNTLWIIVLIPFGILGTAVLFAESYLNLKESTIMSFKYMVYPIVLTLILFFLFSWSKILKRVFNIRHFIAIMILFWGSLAGGVVCSKILKGYQKKRIISFIMPEMDPLGAGYNVRQSLLAVGSGRVLGRGLFGGTQTQLGFLPVRHNDFIYATAAEELGFIGAVLLLAIYAVLLWQIIKILERTEEYGARLIAGGIFALIFVQFVMNIGVTLGMLPVIGIQLPFVSYGGTGMIVFMSLIGVLLNINSKTEIIGR